MCGRKAWTLEDQMWRLSWWTVVLKKTLESPLDRKEIQKDWCWSWSSNTFPHAGKDWRQDGGSELRPWQRSWGRRLDIRKGGIKPQEPPWKSSNIYPHNQSLPTLLLCALPYTSDFIIRKKCPPPLLSGEGVNLELQLIKTSGRDKSILTYKLLWRFSGLPDRLVRPHVIAHSLPTVRGTRCFKPSKNRFLRKVRKLLV